MDFRKRINSHTSAVMKPTPTGLNDDKFDLIFKLVMVGNSSVGKSSFAKRFVEGKFDHKVSASLGIDLETATILRRKKLIRLQIWDTAGQVYVI